MTIVLLDMTANKVPQAAGVGGAADQKAAVVVTADAQQLPAFAGNMGKFFSVPERDDLVVRAVDDQHRPLYFPEIIGSGVLQTGGGPR